MAQPANALSSLAYLAVGALVAARAVGLSRRGRPLLALYGALVLAIGVGSFLFHGPMPSIARFVHDLAIMSVPSFVLAYDLGVARRWHTEGVCAVLGALLGVGATLIATFPDSSDAVLGVLVSGALVAEIGIRPSRRTRSVSPWIAGALVLGLGGLADALGRTGAPWCRPDSAFQWHAVWHVLTALVLGLYAVYVLEPRERARLARPPGAHAGRQGARRIIRA